MNVRISQSTVKGTAQAPPSKSYTHRAILAAGYASGAVVHDPLVSADTKATMRAVTAYGGSVGLRDGGSALDVSGFDGTPSTPDDVIDCANSGTTMRLVTATAALQDGLTVLTGDDSLRSRPQGPLLDAVETDLGGRAESTRSNGQAPLVVGGGVTGGDVSIPGDVSSQYITALLMAGAVSDDGIAISLETELKSAPYVDITLEVLEAFGIEAEETADGFTVAGGQHYEPEDTVEETSTSTQTQSEYGEYHVPGDFSSISYLLAAGVLAAEEELTITSAYPSAQGDTAIVDVVDRMGGDVDWNQDDGVVTVRRSDLTGVEVSVADTPDLLPTIATLGAAAAGTTRIVDCEHVRYKETDRVSAMAEELTAMGASVEEEQDTLTIHGSASDLQGTTVDGRADHRIVMSLAIAGLVADGETTIEGAEHVDVSFPHFFDLLSDVGASVDR